MRVSLWKSLALGASCALVLVASALAEEDAAQDDVARRTERALFKMSHVEAGNKKVRVVTPAIPVAAAGTGAPAAGMARATLPFVPPPLARHYCAILMALVARRIMLVNQELPG